MVRWQHLQIVSADHEQTNQVDYQVALGILVLEQVYFVVIIDEFPLALQIDHKRTILLLAALLPLLFLEIVIYFLNQIHFGLLRRNLNFDLEPQGRIASYLFLGSELS